MNRNDTTSRNPNPDPCDPLPQAWIGLDWGDEQHRFALQERDGSSQTGTLERSEQQEAQQLSAQDKAERCTKARERYDKFMNSQRLYEQQPNGERRYLSSEELDAARASAKATMDVMCK